MPQRYLGEGRWEVAVYYTNQPHSSCETEDGKEYTSFEVYHRYNEEQDARVLFETYTHTMDIGVEVQLNDLHEGKTVDVCMLTDMP